MRLEPLEERFEGVAVAEPSAVAEGDAVAVELAPEPFDLAPVAAFIRQWEGCRLTAYLDTGNVWTIGVGHVEGVQQGDRLTQAEADSLFSKDLASFASKVEASIQVKVNADQLCALISFGFNCGIEALKGSTLLRKLNAGDYDGAAREIPKWCHDGGRIVPGLVNRRSAEFRLFSGQG